MTAPKNDPKPVQATKTAKLDPDSDLPPDADIEERFNNFWKKNAGGIFAGIALGAAVVIGVQVFQYLNERNEEQVREAFAAATTSEEKIAFAEANPDHQLAALALLTVADSLYEEGDYAAAAERYDAAAESFEDPSFAARARIGYGMSLIVSGSGSDGMDVLQAVATDSGALDQIRGEAAYQLAAARLNSGNNEAALEALAIIDLLENATFWEARSEELRKRIQRSES